MIVSACVMPPLPRHARCTVHVTAPHTLGPAVQCVVSGMPFESCGRSVFSRVGQCSEACVMAVPTGPRHVTPQLVQTMQHVCV